MLRDTGGDLGAASAPSLQLDAAWTPLTKVRSPLDYAVATLRALDLPADKQVPLQGVLGSLGQPLWTAPLPNGWPDRRADWAAPEAMMRRFDWSYSIAARAGVRDPAGDRGGRAWARCCGPRRWRRCAAPGPAATRSPCC